MKQFVFTVCCAMEINGADDQPPTENVIRISSQFRRSWANQLRRCLEFHDSRKWWLWQSLSGGDSVRSWFGLTFARQKLVTMILYNNAPLDSTVAVACFSGRGREARCGRGSPRMLLCSARLLGFVIALGLPVCQGKRPKLIQACWRA